MKNKSDIVGIGLFVILIGNAVVNFVQYRELKKLKELATELEKAGWRDWVPYFG